MLLEAHLFSVPNDCLWHDKLWGPSQRVVTLFFAFHLPNYSLGHFALPTFIMLRMASFTRRFLPLCSKSTNHHIPNSPKNISHCTLRQCANQVTKNKGTSELWQCFTRHSKHFRFFVHIITGEEFRYCVCLPLLVCLQFWPWWGMWKPDSKSPEKLDPDLKSQVGCTNGKTMRIFFIA